MSDALEEHISYLSDAIRLDRFEQAIARATKPGDTVVDIGCGVGILGLFCLKTGASHVWGIDRTDAIELARETMRRGGFADRYTCLHAASGQSSLPQPVDIVVCDHVGYFGVDYGIVETIGDARRRFLKPGGQVIPARIVLFAAGVASAACRGIADAWRSEPVPSEYHWLADYGANRKHAYMFEPGEIATPPGELGIIDLRVDSPERSTFSVSLTAARDVELDGLAGWFNCEIAEGVWMTNSPLAADRIARRQAFFPFASPLSVRTGDTVEVTFSLHYELGFIGWTARSLRTGQSARHSTWASTILDPRDRVVPTERVPELNAVGMARKALLRRVDGKATRAEVEAAILSEHPDLFPSVEEIRRFVRSELARSTQ